MIWKNRILRAYGTSLLGVFSGLVTNLWLLREITHHVSTTDFGVYAFVLQISSYLLVLQLGLDFAASRQIAESLGKGDTEAANRAYWELWRVNHISVALVALCVVGLTIAFWSGIALSHDAPIRLAATVALLAGTAQTIGFCSRPYSAALIGSQRLPAVNVVVALRTVVTSVVAYCILLRGLGVLSVPVAEIMTQLAALLVFARICHLHYHWRTARSTMRDRQLLRSILKFGGITTLGGLAWTIEGTSDVVILGWFAGPAAVATYVLWWRFPQMLFDLSTRLAFSAFPGFAERHGQSAEASRSLFGKVSVLTMGMATMTLIGVSVWLPSFIYNWVGSKFSVPNPRLLAFEMGLLVCLRTWGNLLGMFWMATGRSALTTFTSWSQATLKLILALLLVKHYGLIGVVASSCLSAVLQITVVGSLLLKERFLSLSQSLRDLVFVLVAILLALSASQLSINVHLAYLVVGIAATVALWASVWFTFASRTELGPALVPAVGNLMRRLRLPWLVPGR